MKILECLASSHFSFAFRSKLAKEIIKGIEPKANGLDLNGQGHVDTTGHGHGFQWCDFLVLLVRLFSCLVYFSLLFIHLRCFYNSIIHKWVWTYWVNFNQLTSRVVISRCENTCNTDTRVWLSFWSMKASFFTWMKSRNTRDQCELKRHILRAWIACSF